MGDVSIGDIIFQDFTDSRWTISPAFQSRQPYRDSSYAQSLHNSSLCCCCCCCCWLLLLLHECLQSTRNQSQRIVAHVCAYKCACGERKWTRDESRRRYNTDSTARPERLLNLSNEGSLHLSSGHGDGRADKVQPSPVDRAPVPPREDTVYLFIRSPTSFRYFNIVRLRIPG